MPRLAVGVACLAGAVATGGMVALPRVMRAESRAVGRPAAGPVAAEEAPADLTGFLRVAGRPARDVVIWLDVPAASSDSSRTIVTLDQRNLQFVPRVLAVRVGTSVRMPNSDRLLHNVFSFRDGKVFDLGLYPIGTSKTVTFDRPGVSRIFCNIHPNMAAYVVSVESSHVAVSDANGRFVMPDVPEGGYRYQTWRAGREKTQGTLRVQQGQPLEIDVQELAR